MRCTARTIAIAFVLTVAVSTAVTAGTAGAQSGNAPIAAAGNGLGGGEFGGAPPVLGVGLLVAVGGHDGDGTHQTFHADDPSAPRPVFARAIPAASASPGLENLCFTPNGPTGPQYGLGNGWVFDIELFASANGQYLETTGTVCQPLAGPAVNGPPDPPAVAQPPTIGAIWRAAGLAAPPIGTSPTIRGVTGLPTWVWTAGAAPVAVAAGLDGYRITGTARIAGYAVYAGDGRWTRVRGAGSAESPAFTHTYERRGTYRLGVATIWTATAVMTVPGLAVPLTIDLGRALVTNARDYPVVSIRAVLQP